MNDNSILDYRRVRALHHCVMCAGPKATGLIACWRCYNAADLRNCNPVAEATLCVAEAELTDSEIEAQQRTAETGAQWADICLLEARAVALRIQARVETLKAGLAR